jgi:hypothetical protein
MREEGSRLPSTSPLLSSLTTQHLLVAFLVLLAGSEVTDGGEGAGSGAGGDGCTGAEWQTQAGEAVAQF